MAAPLQTGRANPSSNALWRAYPEATASNAEQFPADSTPPRQQVLLEQVRTSLGVA
jgi:hypothetical protein